MSSDAFLIVVEGVSDERLNIIHEIVKDNSLLWWHRMTSVWIVIGKDKPSEWRDLIRPVVRGKGATVLVLRLPRDDNTRGWAFYGEGGGHGRTAWLKDHYRVPKDEEAAPPDEAGPVRQE
jgi:hypothetical protein